MVTFHELIVELLTAEWTNMMLLFPNCQLDILGESPKVEIMLIACQHIRNNARLLLYLTVTHQY